MNTQHSTLHTAIRECADAVAATASGIRSERLADRTPCEKFTVAELLDHLGGTLASSARAARKEAQSDRAAASATSPASVTVSADAPTFHRALAASGRNPDWTG